MLIPEHYGMDIIEADHLSKSFVSFVAVDDVSIAVKEGEIFVSAGHGIF